MCVGCVSVSVGCVWVCKRERDREGGRERERGGDREGRGKREKREGEGWRKRERERIGSKKGGGRQIGCTTPLTTFTPQTLK